jgi:hypothetical protein
MISAVLKGIDDAAALQYCEQVAKTGDREQVHGQFHMPSR